MDEQTLRPQEVEPKVEEPKTPHKKRRLLKPVLTALLVLILMGASGAGAYYWRDVTAKDLDKQKSDDIASYQSKITELEKQLSDAKSSNTNESENVCTEVAPNATVQTNIKASITSANTAALDGYMASSVKVVMAGTEGYESQSATQAISDISNFLTDNISSWDYNFALSAATLANYRQGSYKQYFPSIALIGKATNKQVISFSFDCNGKIDTVFLALDEADL